MLRYLRRLVPRPYRRIALAYAHFGILTLGLVLLVPAWLSSDKPYVAAACLGVSTSLIAAGIASVIFTRRESVLDQIVEYGVVQVWSDRKGRQPRDQQPIHWVREVEKARKKCLLVGTALSGYSIDDGIEFREAIHRLAKDVEFTLLLLDPTCDAARLREDEERRLGDRTIDRIRMSIRALWTIREGLNADLKPNLRLRLYREIPTFALSWVDNYMIVTHYLPGTRNANCPAYALVDLRPFREGETQLYALFERNVTALLRDSQELTADNVSGYM